MIPEDEQGKDRTAGGLGPLFSGLIAATLIALTLVVAVALGMGEQQMIAQVKPTATDTAAPPVATPSPSATLTPVPSTAMPSPIPPSTFTPTASPTPSPTFTPTPTPSPTCHWNPYGWGNIYIVRAGDNLSWIADATGTTPQELYRVNCLTSWVIHRWQRLVVPRRVVPPPPTSTPKPTIPPPVIKTFTLDPADQVIVGECVQIEWVVEGDVALITLLAGTSVLVSNATETGSHSDCPTAIGTRQYTLRAAGPHSSSQQTRSILVVDDSVSPTPTSTGGTSTLTPTSTPTPGGPTETPTPTYTPVPPTDTPTPTNTPEPPTDTPTPTATPVPPTDTPTPTHTPVPPASGMRGIAVPPQVQERSLAT